MVRACQTLLNISNIIFQSIENFVPGIASKKFVSGGIKEMAYKGIKSFKSAIDKTFINLQSVPV